jgi:hypothetical protein
VLEAAYALEAFVHGGAPRDVRVGAMLIAEHFAHVRAVRHALFASRKK